jgi:hypothetical protein
MIFAIHVAKKQRIFSIWHKPHFEFGKFAFLPMDGLWAEGAHKEILDAVPLALPLLHLRLTCRILVSKVAGWSRSAPFGVGLLPFNWGFCRSLFPVWVDRGGRLTYECIFRRRILFYIAGLSRARWTS